MKRYRRRNRRRIKRRRSSLSASNWGPVLALVGTVIGVLAAIALIVFVALPRLLPLIGIDYRAPFSPTPTPTPTPAPTPTPHPMSSFVPAEAQNEVVFDNSADYKWFGDPYFYDGVMALSAGKLVDSHAAMQDLYYYYPETRTAEQVPITLQNAHFMFPKFNDKWLIYLDARLDGGGFLMAYDRTASNAKPVMIKEVYTGQPEPMLDGDYVAWIERTGTRMDKLFVCDLNTMETTTVNMFSSSVYGESLPSLRNGLLCWADAESAAGTEMGTSVLYSIRLSSSTVRTYSPGGYVHDPESTEHMPCGSTATMRRTALCIIPRTREKPKRSRKAWWSSALEAISWPIPRTRRSGSACSTTGAPTAFRRIRSRRSSLAFRTIR